MPSRAAVQPTEDDVSLLHVPRAAQDRYWALVSSKDGALDRIVGSTERIGELRRERQHAERELAELEKAHHDGRLFTAERVHDDATGDVVERRTVDVARLEDSQRRVHAALERLERATKQHELIAAEVQVYGRLTLKAEEYFAETRGKTIQAVAPPAASIRKGETWTEGLDRVRAEISALVGERRVIARGPGSVAEAKTTMRAAVAALAAEGEPELATLFRPERPALVWPQGIIPGLNVNGYTVRTVNAAGLLAALFGDELIRFLDGKIDAIANGIEVQKLTAEERAQRLHEIDAKLLSLGYVEQSLIDHAGKQGAVVTPRIDADIRCVLMIAPLSTVSA